MGCKAVDVIKHILHKVFLIVTPSLERLPTKAKETPPHEVKPTSLDSNAVFQCFDLKFDFSLHERDKGGQWFLSSLNSLKTPGFFFKCQKGSLNSLFFFKFLEFSLNFVAECAAEYFMPNCSSEVFLVNFCTPTHSD